MPKKEPLYPHVPKSRAKGRLEALREIIAAKTVEDVIILKEKYQDVELTPDDVAAIDEHIARLGKKQVEDIEIERYHGIIVRVGGINTKTPNLPDWDISYVQYPPGRMKEYRDALMKARVSIVRVTDMRIYFEQK